MSIEKLPNNILINDKVKSIYNFNEYSLQDLLCRFFETINQCVDTSNNYFEFLTLLKSECLQIYLYIEINEMYQDWRLTDLINKLANDVKGMVDNISGDISQFKQDVNTNINQFKQDVNTNLSNLQNNVLPNINIDGGVWNG